MSRRALLVIALVAALARVSFELALRHDRAAGGAVGTQAGSLLGDEQAYDQLARHVAAGDQARERAFYQEPLYGWLLGQLYGLAPPPPVPEGAPAVPHAGVHVAVFTVQHALGVLLALLVAGLAARCFGGQAGLLAGLFAALSGPLIFTESMLLKESLALLLWVLALQRWLDLLQDRAGRWRAPLLGALLGLTILLRGNAWLLLALVLGTLLLRVGGRRRVRLATPVLAAALLVIAPVTISNLRHGDVVLTTYQAGSNAAIGQPDSDDPRRGVTYEPLRAGRGDAQFEEQDAVAIAEAGEGRRLSGREVSAWWWRETARRVGAHFGAAMQRVGRKLLHTFHGDEVPDVKDWRFVQRVAPWLATPLSDLSWLGPLGLAGLLLLPWRRPRGDDGRREGLREDLLVVRGSVGVVAVSLALFYVMGRYRLPAAPGLWILAAGLLVSLREPRRRALTLAAAVVAVGLGQIPLRAEAAAQHGGWASTSSVERSLARTAATPEEARAHRDAAVAAAREAIRLEPGFAEARVALIYALDLRTPLLQPRAGEAFEEAWRLLLLLEAQRSGSGLGDALQGDLASVQQAATAMRARSSQPGAEAFVAAPLALACRRVAQDLRQPRELPLALELVDEALRLRPDDGDTLVQRGLVLVRLGRAAEAEAAWRDALARGVDTVSLHFNLGLLLLDTGRATEAVTQLERALQLEPGNAAVAQQLERARTTR